MQYTLTSLLKGNGIHICYFGVRIYYFGVRIYYFGVRICYFGVRICYFGVRICYFGELICYFGELICYFGVFITHPTKETTRRVETYAGHTCVYTVASKRRSHCGGRVRRHKASGVRGFEFTPLPATKVFPVPSPRRRGLGRGREGAVLVRSVLDSTQKRYSFSITLHL